MYLTRIMDFAAAHRLASGALTDAENQALYGQCFRTHGHNYALEVTVRGPLGPDGTVMDLAVLERAMRSAVVDLVDHRDLDRDVPALSGLVTTGENLAASFFRMLEPALPAGRLHRVAVVETANNRFEFDGPRGETPEARHRDET